MRTRRSLHLACMAAGFASMVSWPTRALAANQEPAGINLGNGYYFRQLNLDWYEMRDGSTNQGIFNTDLGKASFLGIGPGLMWSVAEHDKLFANFYTQTAVRNWPEADLIVNLRWIHGFEGADD